MDTTTNTTAALVAWARETISELQEGFGYLPEGKGALPDVVCELLTSGISVNDGSFPFAQIQQAWLRVWEYELSFMVENDDTQAAAELLEDFTDRLVAAALQDVTLGGRVEFISPELAFDLTPPFVEYPDGTRGREMTMQISVGALIEGGPE